MVLVDRQIEVRLADIFPEVKQGRKTVIDAIHSQINPNSIDLTIQNKIMRPQIIPAPVEYGLKHGVTANDYKKYYWRTEMCADKIVMRPGDIILACTREIVSMPPDLCGQLFAKSTLGRMFINHMMAGVVDAGFHGRLTLELKNEGIHTVEIPVGARVVQMVIYDLGKGVDTPYGERNSRYQNSECVLPAGAEKC